MRRRSAMITGAGFVILAVVFTLPAAAPAAPAADEGQCQTEGEAEFRGASAKASGNRVCRTLPKPSGEPTPVSPEGVWNTYCRSVGGWRSGNEVDIAQGSRATGTVTVYDLAFHSNRYGQTRTPSTEQIIIPASLTFYHYTISCRTPTGVSIRGVVLPQGAVPVSPIAIRERVKARIVVPSPAMAANPPLDDPERFSIVQFPTWLWIEDPWLPITETETQAGLTVTVTATPTKVLWDTGDGETETCFDAGTPWRDGLPESAVTCSHTYVRTSAAQPDYAFELSATVHWVFNWSLNGTQQGQFATYNPTTTVANQVGEILSVGTPNPTPDG